MKCQSAREIRTFSIAFSIASSPDRHRNHRLKLNSIQGHSTYDTKNGNMSTHHVHASIHTKRCNPIRTFKLKHHLRVSWKLCGPFKNSNSKLHICVSTRTCALHSKFQAPNHTKRCNKVCHRPTSLTTKSVNAQTAIFKATQQCTCARRRTKRVTCKDV